jgi:GNAT superfamily N-acetyltransferase
VQVETWRTTYRGIVPDAYLAGLNTEQRALRWRERLSTAEHILVAELNGEVVGFVSGGAIREPLEGYDAEIHAIYLLVRSQRTGIGTDLIIELARRLDEAGFKSMVVWLFEANTAARFYEKSGAVRIGVKEREIGGVRLPLLAYGWPNIKSISACRRDK